MKKMMIGIPVHVTNNVSTADVVKALQALLDIGVADARATLADNEGGDLDMAELVDSLELEPVTVLGDQSTVAIRHWDEYYTTDLPCTHELEVTDQRRSAGQLHCTLRSTTLPSDLMPVTMEVNTNPITESGHGPVPCVHILFNEDAMAMSLYKIGAKLLIRPEVQVDITKDQSSCFGVNETVFWVENTAQAAQE